jgi:N-acetylneuraminate synthase
MGTSFQLGRHRIGAGSPPFVIAEMSGNHNGELARALAIVDAAAEAGAHALKIQTYTADTMTLDVDAAAFRISDEHGLWSGRRLHDLYAEAHTPWDWHAPIFERARERGLVAFSSPFDASAIEFLEELDAPLYKIASAEIVDLPLIARAAQTGKPLVLSTGMATLAEIDAAVSTARSNDARDIVVLACTSAYPAPPGDAHLGSIAALRAAFDVVVGLSDHTQGIGVSVAAVALGASVIEKHVTLDRADGGVDAAFSLDPAELSLLTSACLAAHAAVQPARFGPRESELEVLRLRRSLFVVADVDAGDPVTRDNVRSIRPSGGLLPADLDIVLGRTFRQRVVRGTPLTWDLV